MESGRRWEKVRKGKDGILNFSKLGNLCWRMCVCLCVHTCILVMCTKEVSVHCYLLRSRSSFLFTFVPKVGMVSLEHINKPGLSPRIVQQDKPSRIRVVFWSSSF